MRKQFLTYLLLGIFIVITSQCEKIPVKKYEIYFENYIDADILIYFAFGGKRGVVYPDTTLTIDKELIKRRVQSEKTYHNVSSNSIEDMFNLVPQDTVSIYIFHSDTIAKYSWEEIQNGYKILRRYDLSRRDFNFLKNEYDIPVITYPPDERMKNMKMYPPYGE